MDMISQRENEEENERNPVDFINKISLQNRLTENDVN